MAKVPAFQLAVAAVNFVYDKKNRDGDDTHDAVLASQLDSGNAINALRSWFS